MSTYAPASRSFFTIVTWPPIAADMRAVFPFCGGVNDQVKGDTRWLLHRTWSWTWMSALASSSSCTFVSLPQMAARIMAVCPYCRRCKGANGSGQRRYNINLVTLLHSWGLYLRRPSWSCTPRNHIWNLPYQEDEPTTFKTAILTVGGLCLKGKVIDL